MIGLVRSTILLVLGVMVLGGCAEFFRLPPARSRDIALSKLSWPNNRSEADVISLEAIDQSVEGFCWGERPDWPAEGVPPAEQGPAAGRALVASFLHVSDAQLRDESMFGAPGEDANLSAFDDLVNVTVRRPLVEEYDTLTLASILAAYRDFIRKSHASMASDSHPFVVHTGDLLDLSVASELMDALSVFAHFTVDDAEKNPNQTPLRIFSVAGNHDGLLFGNTPEWLADLQDVGINQSEFVLGHIVADAAARSHRAAKAKAGATRRGAKKQKNLSGNDDAVLGYGFAWNENVRARHSALPLAPLEGDIERDVAGGAIQEDTWWIKLSRDGFRDAVSRSLVPHDVKALSEVQAFKHAVRVPSTVNDVGLSLGYYSWSQDIPLGDSGFKRIRFVVLDTRARVNESGDLDQVQRGWLYNILCGAMKKREAVVLFAHHQPSEFRATPPGLREVVLLKDYRLSDSRRSLERMLKEFPNVIGYFYGHEHGSNSSIAGRRTARDVGTDDYAMIQTGSLADAPQVGRLVEIRSQESSAVKDGFVAEINWRFVRPAVDVSTANGLRLSARLRASRKEADVEGRETTVRKLSNRWIHFIPKSSPKRTPEIARECEGANSVFLDAEGRLPTGSQLTVHGRFLAECPAPSKIFGEGWVERFHGGASTIDYERRAVGLEPLQAAGE